MPDILVSLLPLLVPAVASAIFWALKRWPLAFIDEQEPRIQQALLTILLAVPGAIAAFLGVTLPSGVEFLSVEGIAILLNTALAMFGVHGVVKPKT